jgi:N,N'-diacetyllegionaminate synthase
LRAIRTLADAFGFPVGYSDHTEGIEASVLAVGAGACLVEKHFTLDKTMEGPDHKASVEPGELAELVRQVRAARSMLGNGQKKPSKSEADVAKAARKSVVAGRRIPKGRRLAMADLAFKRPGTGIPPYMVGKVIGRKARRDIPEDAVIEEGWLDG